MNTDAVCSGVPLNVSRILRQQGKMRDLIPWVRTISERWNSGINFSFSTLSTIRSIYHQDNHWISPSWSRPLNLFTLPHSFDPFAPLKYCSWSFLPFPHLLPTTTYYTILSNLQLLRWIKIIQRTRYFVFPWKYFLNNLIRRYWRFAASGTSWTSLISIQYHKYPSFFLSSVSH